MRLSDKDKKELEEAKQKFKSFYKKGRFQEIKGYKFDKRIFRSCAVISVTFLLVLIIVNGFSFSQKFYYECPLEAHGNICENPFYQTTQELPSEFQPWINEEYLPAGLMIGERPTWVVSNFHLLVIGVFLAGLLFNHFRYNFKKNPRNWEVEK